LNVGTPCCYFFVDNFFAQEYMFAKWHFCFGTLQRHRDKRDPFLATAAKRPDIKIAASFEVFFYAVACFI